MDFKISSTTVRSKATFRMGALILGSLLLILPVPSLHSQETTLKPEYQKLVKRLVTAVSADDRLTISKLVNYPLAREYPIPPVANKKEFLKRFDQIFDKDMRDEIVHSSIAHDWEEVGWRGIMLDRGSLWIDTDGTITAINHKSDAERRLREELIEKDRKSLSSSLQKYEEPVLIGETNKFLIRVDDLGNDKYRYASWSKGSKQSSKPDLILYNGDMEFDGSGGNHYFDFKNEVYVYQVYVSVMGGDNDSPGWLEIDKAGKPILTQNFKRLDY